MKIQLVFLAALVAVEVATLCGCGATSKRVAGPDDGAWYQVECKYKDTCYSEARKRCPFGYQIEDDEEQLKGVHVATYNEHTTIATPITRNFMLIKCE